MFFQQGNNTAPAKEALHIWGHDAWFLLLLSSNVATFSFVRSFFFVVAGHAKPCSRVKNNKSCTILPNCVSLRNCQATNPGLRKLFSFFNLYRHHPPPEIIDDALKRNMRSSSMIWKFETEAWIMNRFRKRKSRSYPLSFHFRAHFIKNEKKFECKLDHASAHFSSSLLPLPFTFNNIMPGRFKEGG